MSSRLGLMRRGVTALVVAFGLLLMHGGIGQAMACTGMSEMASQVTPPMSGGAMSAHQAVDQHAQHHQPANDPVSAHGGQMCVSTPAATSGGDTKAGPAVIEMTLGGAALDTPYVATITRASGREPPAPDLVSVLCVNRV